MFKKKSLIKASMLLAISVSIFLIIIFLIRYSTDQSYRIIFITKTVKSDMPFWETLNQGMYTAAQELNVDIDIYGPDNESEVEVQNSYIRKAIEQKPDAVILAAAHYTSQIDLCKQIVQSGAKLITVDSDIDSDIKTSFIGTDNFQAGKCAGQALSNIVSEQGKIAIISFVKGTAPAISREQGFMAGLTDRQRYNVIGPYYCDTTAEEASRITKKILQDNPDIEGIVGLNEPSVSGAAVAVDKMNLGGKIKVVGIDSSLTEIKYLESDIIDTIIVQKPFNMGYLSVVTAVESLKGKKVKKFINTGIEVITKENMYTKENQKLLFIFDDLPHQQEN